MVHNPFFFFRHIGSNGAEVRERPALGMGNSMVARTII